VTRFFFGAASDFATGADCAYIQFQSAGLISASHATLDPDRACSAALDGTLSLSKAVIRLTQMMKAGNTFLYVRCVMFSSSVPDAITPANLDDRSAPSYDRSATLVRIAQNPSLWRGSAALKPQFLEPPGPKIAH
jgi:hypothetical protein